MRDFREMKVWERGHRLTLEVCRATAAFPDVERYGLAGQLRRASASIPANIAEGCGRSGDAELARFMQVAMGSASELEYHLLLAHDLSYLSDSEYDHLNQATVEVKKMLASFITSLRR
jgi:four helix bundle protein